MALPTVAIVTPSTAQPHLLQCIQSVATQSYKNIKHYIVVDGEEYLPAIAKMRIDAGRNNIKLITLEENVGAQGWYGHRVYAACSFLVDADIIVYLDEDNWVDEDHIAQLVAEIQGGSQWAYSLRKIVNVNGEYICNDDCESLGKWPVYNEPQRYHIDTSCFAIPIAIALKLGHSWYAQWGADRIFFATLKKHYPLFSTTGKYTLNYRLGSTDTSVQESFFINGNDTQQSFPWRP